MSENKYIIFLNGDMKGYLNNEEDTKKKVSDLADFLEMEENKKTKVPIKIFRENIENGINIYTQIIGQYVNGTLFLQHVIKWKCIPEYNDEIV